ncbi:MAG: DUF1499 domain-containing protein [Proteobacteria bacterium]|nr:DUF1499 domain-containing protein [Pseudomonadota bacterium]
MKQRVMVLFFSLLICACSGSRPMNLGVKAGLLVPCPGKPNCVVTNEADQKHYIPPIPYSCDQDVAFGILKDILVGMERTEIIEETPIYIRLEFKTKTFGFVDDVEFYFPSEPVIYMRSASRVGLSDLGVNRKRLEKIRSLFEEKIKDVDISTVEEAPEE